MDSMADKLAEQGKHINTLEATMALHGTFFNKLQAQLNTKELKNEPRVCLLGDGLPVLLTSDVFYEKANANKKRMEDEENRKQLAVRVRQTHLEEMRSWKEADEE